MPLNVILFPGQGSQFQGMGADLFKEFPETLAMANDVLGYDVAELCKNNPDNLLNQTNYTQPALFLVNYLTYQNYLKSNTAPDYFLGHSLGEFNALNAAGVFDFETGLRIVQKRGELMLSINGTGMAAVLGSDYESLKAILDSNFPELDIANINTYSQIVISGPLDLLDTAADFIEDEGLGYIPLKVSGAFHSRYMTPVKDSFKEYVETMKLNSCSTPVISNYTADLYPLAMSGVLTNMVNQIDSPVKWLQSIEFVMTKGECDFKEVGPGEVLTNVLKKIKSNIVL
jgi:malonyl CoA-acyl carrier protein transacylase